MELLIFGHSGRAVLFFPTRTARFYDYENWEIVAALSEKLEHGELQLFCVHSIDAESFYNQSVHPEVRIARHLQYEQYLLKEVIPFMRIKNGGDFLEVAGCSMGAYHAINLAFKFPDLFRKVVGMSGRYDLTKTTGFFKDLFDGYQNESIYFNMPIQYIANLDDEVIKDKIRKLDIILAIGEEDAFLHDNQSLSQMLFNKGIVNQLYIWSGNAHRPRYWKQMVPIYL